MSKKDRGATNMRVLVFGAGVLGSYLAHVLVRGGMMSQYLPEGNVRSN